MLVGDVFEQLATLPDDSVDCVVTSPPYWGLRKYTDAGSPEEKYEIGLEPTLGQHLEVMVRLFREVRRVLKPKGCCWINYGDTYATKPNGRSAAAVKAAGKDDRSFQDKPFSTIGPINPIAEFQIDDSPRHKSRAGRTGNLGNGSLQGMGLPPGRVVAPVASYDPNYAPGARGKTQTAGPGKTSITRVEHAGRVVAGPTFDPLSDDRRASRGPRNRSLHDGRKKGGEPAAGNIRAGGYLKPKDLCLLPNRLAIALQDDGWWVRSEIVWGKPNPMPDSSGKYRPSTAHEKVWLLTKSEHSYYDHMAVKMPASGGAHARVAASIRANGAQMASLFGEEDISSSSPVVNDRTPGIGSKTIAAGVADGPRAKANPNFNAAMREMYEDRFLRNYEPDLSPLVPPQVWEIPTASFPDAHFATFPPALVVPCLLSSCPIDGVVLDPFGGSGTVALVAQKLARNSILIELKPEYAEMARRRVAAGDIGMKAIAE
jgi:DNA modification methylase